MLPESVFQDKDNLFSPIDGIKLADIFPIRDIDNEGDLITLEGNLCRVYELSSTHSALNEEEAIKLAQIKDHFLNSLPEGIEIIYHIDRNKALSQSNIEIKNDYLKPIQKLYAKTLKNIYDCRNFITLTTRRNIADTDIDIKNRLKSADGCLIALGNIYNVKKLATGESLGFLSSFFDREIKPYPMAKTLNISDGFASLDVNFIKTKKFGILPLPANYYKLGDKYAAILTIQSFASVIHELTLNTISNQQFPLRYSISFVPIDSGYYTAKLAKDINFYNNQRLAFNARKLQETNNILMRLEAGETRIFKFTLNIELRCDDLKTLERRVSIIEQAFGGEFKLKQESLNLPNAVFSRLPTYADRINIKSVHIEKEPLNIFFSIGTSNTENQPSPFGSNSICQFKTNSGSIFNFKFHRDMTSPNDMPLGHTLVIGQSGLGKTSFISFLLANCLKYEGIKIINFDQSQGLRIFTEFAGGEFSDVGIGDLQLNPFQLRPNKQNKNFLMDFIANLAGINEKDYDKVSETISLALDDLFTLNSSDRYLDQMRENFKGKVQLEAIKKWYRDGKNAQYFNSKKDSLSFDSQLSTFDMYGVIEDSHLLGQIMQYITYKIEQECSGKPHIIFIDEMPRYLESEVFSKQIESYIQQLRKKNGVLAMAIQTPKTFFIKPSASTIFNNTETLICFPSSNGYDDIEKYTEDIFSAQEIKWLRTSTSARQVMIKSKSTKHSVIIDINLRMINQYLKVFDSSIKSVQTMLNIKRQHPGDWRQRYLEFN